MIYVILLLVGLIVGTFVIIFGGGGAAIYLGILTGIMQLPAASTSLVTVLPSLMLGCWTYYKHGQIKVKLGNQMLLTAISAVIIGSLISQYIPFHLYNLIVGGILVILGINMFFQKRNHAGNTKQKYPKLKAGLFGVIGGLMVGVAGMSGKAPIIAGLFLMGLPMINAAATSSYVLAFMSVVGTIFHIAGGKVDWNIGISLMIGALIGAAIAPALLEKIVHTKIGNYLEPVVAVFLAVLGIKTLL